MRCCLFKRYFLIIVFLVKALSVEADDSFLDKGTSVNISSDNLEISLDSNIAHFSGNVTISQGDTKFHSDKVIIYYNKGQNNSSSIADKKIDKIEAIGHVKLLAKDKQAYSNKAIYNFVDDKLEMYDNVKLIQNDSYLYGDMLTYNLKNGKAKISSTGGTSKVKAVINTKSKKEK